MRFYISIVAVCFLLASCGEKSVYCQEPVETLYRTTRVMEKERISESDYKENGIQSIQRTTVLTPLSLSIVEYAPHYRDQIVRNPAWTIVRETITPNRYDSDWMIHGVCGDATAHFSLAKDDQGSYTMETTIERQP